jgi:hypothetical protein
MKKFYLLIFLVALFNIAFAAPVITASSNNYWNLTSTWNLNRLPQAGDTIVIPAGITVTINDDQSFSSFVYIKVLGNLKFQNNNSTLSVITPSVIMVLTGGKITGGGSASQKIRFDNSAIFTGDEVPVIGPQLASIATNGFTPFFLSPLPVKFIGFTLTRKSNDVLIQWSTSEEAKAYMYEVEHSTDGANWNTIAYVAAVGNSSGINNYSFTDKNISSKTVYYRVKEVDIDGKENYTSIKSIKSETSSSTEINIAGIQNKVLMQFPQQIKGNLLVRFISASGQIIDQQNINNPVGQVVLNSKVTGNYIISISNGQEINTAKQVIL